mgnify:CR=1 FL=1
MSTVSFFVAGVPVPQGSMRAFMPKGGHFPVVTADNKGMLPWRQRIATEAQRAMEGRAPFLVPVSVAAQFHLPRPKSRPKRDLFPDRKPDVDKLARAVLDSLTGIVFRDDAQVCSLFVVKHYARGATGVEVSIYDLAESPGLSTPRLTSPLLGA